MQQLDVTEFWIAFGVGKSFRYLSVHSISEALGPCFMPSLDVIRHLFSQAGERRLHGMHDRCLTRSQKL